jgi:hypothetical protein
VRRGKVVSQMVGSSVMTTSPPVLEERIKSRPRRRGVPWERVRRVWDSASVGRENIAGLDGRRDCGREHGSYGVKGG